MDIANTNIANTTLPHPLITEPVTLGEATRAKKYWASLGDTNLGFYEIEQHWSVHLAELVEKLGVMKVFEFGCHVGRNLRCIKERSPNVKVGGIDVNSTAVKHGKEKYGLDIKVGDHNYLSKIKANTFDAVITVSALDHVVSVHKLIKDMINVASKYLIFIEPSEEGVSGKLIQYFNQSHNKMMNATPFTYIWDYKKIIESLGKKVTITPYPLRDVALGMYYKKIVVEI